MHLITALYDANVLYPAPLRDLFMRLAEVGLVQPKWSDEIHEEWIRNLLKDRPNDFTRERLERTRDLMNRHAGDCLVTGYESLIPMLTEINESDRHVVAAAIVGEAEVIVTRNLRDFPPPALKKHGLVAQAPDEFVAELFDLEPDRVCEAVRRQRADLKKPPISVDRLLHTLDRNELHETVTRLMKRKGEL